MRPLRIAVIGTLASNPYAGMAWMHMQIVCGLLRLGHDVHYYEITSDWPYDPVRQGKVDDSNYAVPYLARVARNFGLEGRWAYRRSYSDKEWLGKDRREAESLLATADLVLNVTGATRIAEEGLDVGRLVYLGTDPVLHEVGYEQGNPVIRALIDEHDDAVTYGENIGTAASPITPLPRLRARTRQPILMDCWSVGGPTRDVFTTVANWQQVGLDIEFRGESYRWSKHHEILKLIDLPLRTSEKFELATNLGPRTEVRPEGNEAVPAVGLATSAREMLESNGWLLADGPSLTMDPWNYRNYIIASRAEFTVARDLNVRLRSGWFSERSACYLAAGRPVITQDTGFGEFLPTGEGLFAFNTLEEVLSAVDEINANYGLHSKAARDLAEEYFRAETVLLKLLQDLGY